MSILKVFSGTLKTNEINKSIIFSNAVGLFISTPNLNTDYEIDCYIQVHFTIDNSEFIRNYPLSKIKDSSLFFNRISTDTLFILPTRRPSSRAIKFAPASRWCDTIYRLVDKRKLLKNDFGGWYSFYQAVGGFPFSCLSMPRVGFNYWLRSYQECRTKPSN